MGVRECGYSCVDGVVSCYGDSFGCCGCCDGGGFNVDVIVGFDIFFLVGIYSCDIFGERRCNIVSCYLLLIDECSCGDGWGWFDDGGSNGNCGGFEDDICLCGSCDCGCFSEEDCFGWCGFGWCFSE